MKLNSSNYIYYSFLLIFVIVSCIPIDYIGDTYPPTNNVEVFYSEKDIVKHYVVFGHIMGSKASIDDIKDELEIEAMKKGADGIVFKNVDFEATKKSKTNKISASLIKYTE
jgi:hypothetical protein